MRNLLIVLLLISSLANAQTTPLSSLRNDNASTTVQSTNLGNSRLSTDLKGRLHTIRGDTSSELAESVVGASSATGLGGTASILTGSYFIQSTTLGAGSTASVFNIAGHAAIPGDLIIMRTGTAGNLQAWSPVKATTANTITLSYPLPTTPTTGDGLHIRRSVPLSANANNGNSVYNSLQCNIDTDGQAVTATGILKREDAAHASTDAGVMSLNVANETGNNLVGTDLDYVPQASHLTGVSLVNIWESAVPLAARNRSILKQEDVAHVSGDSGVMALAVRNDNIATTLAGTNGDYSPVSVDNVGALYLAYSTQYAPLKLEDQTHATGDAGVVGLGMRNDTAVALSGADLDYTVPVVNQYGGQVMDLDIRFQGNGTPSRSPIRAEDAAAGNQDALMSVGGVRRDDVNADAANGDYANFNLDADGKLFVNATGSGMGDYINGCSPTAVTTNTTQTLVAADADERFYVTGFECQNTSATATNVILEDGAGTDLARCYNPASTAGGNCFVNVGNVPIRVANTNSLLQINVVTTGSSTTCCVRGYKSPN